MRRQAGISIRSLGDNITRVRGGSMDVDTPDFGLDLGPNALTLQGYYMDVRLQNISCKTLAVHIEHGNFFAQDMG